jgi:ABC-2 type transport system permease protein
MSAATAVEQRPAVAPLPQMVLAQTRAVLLTRLRMPAFTVLSLGLPVMFFALFNAIYGSQRAAPGVSVLVASFILVSYGVYAAANVMVFNFGIGIAGDRSRKLDLLQRAMPLPPLVSGLAQIISAVIFAVLGLLILFAFGSLVGGVRFDTGTWLDLIWKLLVGSIPMLGLGMAIGYATGINTAPAVVNVIYLPMAFLSGIFVPFSQLPATIQKVGQVLPLYHAAQLAWSVFNVPTLVNESVGTALLWLAGWSIVLFAAAFRLYRLDESRKFN